MTRPRGFIESWVPQLDTMRLVNDVRTIIDDNADIAPLTLRQIFYMLVTGYGFDKTEKAYKRLCEIMNKARRAQLIDMDSIRDDGLRREDPRGWASQDSFLRAVRREAKQFRLHRQQDQEQEVIVWCEAGGMVPQLASYCEDYGVSVISSGGFDSLTSKHDFAKEVSDNQRTIILHVGDHDPSGVHMHKSLDEDLQAFVDYYGGEIEVDRIAVVPWQVEEFNLPTAPPKVTDKRSFDGLTTQAEALPPRTLKEIVVMQIEDRMDMDVYHKTIEEESSIRAALVEHMAQI